MSILKRPDFQPMRIPPIETEEEYEAALLRLAELLEALDDDAEDEDEEREALLEAIEAYEDELLPKQQLKSN